MSRTINREKSGIVKTEKHIRSGRIDMAAEFGYAGEILKVDLSSKSMADIPKANYARKYIGGEGIAAII